jgi:hypothetical protein
LILAPDTKLVAESYGLPQSDGVTFGDLVIEFEISFPDSIESSLLRDQLRAALGGHSNEDLKIDEITETIFMNPFNSDHLTQ